MSTDCELSAKEFLLGLSAKEQTKLYNDLLALQEVHRLNNHNAYYTFKNFQHIAKRHCERRKRSFRYVNSHNTELVIHQIHEQHFFKNTYKLQIFLNCHEYDYPLLEQLMNTLACQTTSETVHYQHAVI